MEIQFDNFKDAMEHIQSLPSGKAKLRWYHKIRKWVVILPVVALLVYLFTI